MVYSISLKGSIGKGLCFYRQKKQK